MLHPHVARTEGSRAIFGSHQNRPGAGRCAFTSLMKEGRDLYLLMYLGVRFGQLLLRVGAASSGQCVVCILTPHSRAACRNVQNVSKHSPEVPHLSLLMSDYLPALT